MEGTAWPGAGTVELWDVHSQVFTETTHRTYVYQASDTAAASRLHVCSPCPGLGGGALVQRKLQSHLACPGLAVAGGLTAVSLHSLRGPSLGEVRSLSLGVLTGLNWMLGAPFPSRG